MNRFILALDQGTTSSRTLVIDHGGHVVASAQKEFQQHYPQPGLVEHEPADLWETQAQTAREAMNQAGIEAAQIAGIGITNQRETTLVWERKTGKPVHRAIVWQDRRTAEMCRRWEKEGLGSLVTQRTGLRLDPYFSGSKIRWILDHIPEGQRRAERGELCFGTVDTWLVWNLTQGRSHLTDVSNASRTLLMNIATCAWDDELLAAFDVPRAMLPEIVPSSLSSTVAEVIAKGVPVSGIAGDQQSALFGQACFNPGMAKNTYGTGCFLLAQTGTRIVASQNNLLTTVAWKLGDAAPEYALEGSVFIAGAVFQWLRDELRLASSAEELAMMAATVPDTGGVFFVPAFTGLGAPHWDPDARGLLIGLTRGTSAAHIARAAVEAVAFQSADLLACMERDSGIPLKELRVDGGASRSDLLMQIQSDLLGVPVIRPRCVETTALGAAYLAGLATGFWENQAEIANQWEEDRRFLPARDGAWRQDAQGKWNRAVELSKGWNRDAA